MAACKRREPASREVAKKEVPATRKKPAPVIAANKTAKNNAPKPLVSARPPLPTKTAAVTTPKPTKTNPLSVPDSQEPLGEKITDRLPQSADTGAKSTLTVSKAGLKVDKIVQPQGEVAGRPAEQAEGRKLALNTPAPPIVKEAPPKPKPPVFKLPDIGRRVALVIGNGSYRNAPRLPNPANDANDIAKSLAQLRFQVRKAQNVDRLEFLQVLSEFSRDAMGAEIALIFYAGHGLEIDGENYLIPVDARLETDIQVRFEAVRLDDMLASLEGVAGLRMIMLDACRNNPFLRSMKVTVASRSVGRGFARIEPRIGTLVSYSAKEGTTASDGDGRNSPYTAAVIAHIRQQGIEVNKFFRIVRDSVLTATDNTQEPYLYGSTSSEDVFLSPAPILVSTP